MGKIIGLDKAQHNYDLQDGSDYDEEAFQDYLCNLDDNEQLRLAQEYLASHKRCHQVVTETDEFQNWLKRRWLEE